MVRVAQLQYDRLELEAVAAVRKAVRASGPVRMRVSGNDVSMSQSNTAGVGSALSYNFV